MPRRLLAGVGLIIILGFEVAGLVRANESRVVVHLFGSKTCPHCEAEREYLGELVGEKEWVEAYYYEVTNREAVDLLVRVAGSLGLEVNGVPLTVVGDKSFAGFADNSAFKGYFQNFLAEARADQGRDVVEELKPVGFESRVKIEGKEAAGEKSKEWAGSGNEVIERINMPILGELEIEDLSLPVLTFMIALLDGFNPCAMWVLLFLISLLLGMKNRKRMWVLGGVFVLTSGMVYFLFLAAWLNLFLFLEYISWVRIGIGLFALGVGGYYLRDYRVNKSGGCRVSGDEGRRRVLEKLGGVVQQRNFVLAVAGIVGLAVAVNMVELVCSAGLPAIYTQVLALTSMPKWQYYLYLVFYIAVFMLDDMVVFGVAMVTLRAVGISGKYARYSHLVGGVVMLMIGGLMLLKPEWLMFG